MGVLDRLPGIVNGALGSLVFKDGTLLIPGAATSDGQGGFTYADPAEKACKAIATEYSTYRRVNEGIPASDKLVLVLAASIAGGVTPRIGYRIEAADPMNAFALQEYEIIAVGTDPAAATYELQAR